MKEEKKSERIDNTFRLRGLEAMLVPKKNHYAVQIHFNLFLIRGRDYHFNGITLVCFGAVTPAYLPFLVAGQGDLYSLSVGLAINMSSGNLL